MDNTSFEITASCSKSRITIPGDIAKVKENQNDLKSIEDNSIYIFLRYHPLMRK